MMTGKTVTITTKSGGSKVVEPAPPPKSEAAAEVESPKEQKRAGEEDVQE